MKARLLAWAARFNALARRERLLIALALVAGIVLIGNALVVEPPLAATRIDDRRIEQARSELASLNAQIDALRVQPDPDAPTRAALETTRRELAAIDGQLAAMETAMVPPDKMRQFLESLLLRHRQVELVSLKTLAPAALIEKPVAPAGTDTGTSPAAPNIYRHGIELRIAGRYNDLLAYLAELERMPQHVVWNRLALATEQYPRSVLTVTIFTLSLEKQWLTV